MHAVNYVRLCFWHCLWLFCSYIKYLRNHCTDLQHIHTKSCLVPYSDKLKVKVNFGGVRAVYIWSFLKNKDTAW